jgi:hypothetical protein
MSKAKKLSETQKRKASKKNSVKLHIIKKRAKRKNSLKLKNAKQVKKNYVRLCGEKIKL